MTRPAAALWGVAVLLALTGCESTVDAARKISQQGTRAFQTRGLTVTRIDRRIHVISTAIVRDANGTAAVVAVRNTGATAMTDAPIAIDVLGSGRRSIFRNNSPGLETSLTHVPLLLPGKQVDWVNDQVLPAGTPVSVVARVGAGRALGFSPPKIKTRSVQLSYDDVSGWTANGMVDNASRVAQLRLVLYATARRQGRIVAAGRAIVTRLMPGQERALSRLPDRQSSQRADLDHRSTLDRLALGTHVHTGHAHQL